MVEHADNQKQSQHRSTPEAKPVSEAKSVSEAKPLERQSLPPAIDPKRWAEIDQLLDALPNVIEVPEDKLDQGTVLTLISEPRPANSPE